MSTHLLPAVSRVEKSSGHAAVVMFVQIGTALLKSACNVNQMSVAKTPADASTLVASAAHGEWHKGSWRANRQAGVLRGPGNQAFRFSLRGVRSLRTLNIVAQCRGLLFHFTQPVFDDVADRHNADQLISLNHWNVPELACGHLLHDRDC
jgi:hypothetical protein